MATLVLQDLTKLAEDYNLNTNTVAFDLNDKQLVKRMRRESLLVFSDEQMREFFEPTLKQICDCVKRILQTSTEVSVIVLVGGYGSSAVLGDRIRSIFQASPFDKKVIIPDSTVRPQAAIAHGASYYGLYTTVIGTRIAEKSYGVKTSEKWYPGCPYAETDAEWDVERSEKRVKNLFSSIVRLGTRIKPGDTFKTGDVYSPLYSYQERVSFEVYESDLYSPKFTKEKCKKLGEVVVPCRGINDNFSVEFTFGSELRVEVVRQDGDRNFATIEVY